MRLNPGAGSPPPRCHFTHSFFASKLYLDSKEYNYDNVMRWTTPEKLKECKQV